MNVALGSVVDRYVIEDVLGEGGMARVFAVRHVELGSRHALKLLTLDRPVLAERLRSEGRVQAGLRHPHLVAVHDVIEVDGNPGLVMELVDGMDLDRWIAENPDASHETRMALARQILGAVGYAHANGVIHRDLKPGNVMITEVAGQPFAKVADFGLAKAAWSAGAGLTKTGIPMGTPRYMAPEQLTDAKHVDARADVFALGCVIHELWTGAPAFAAESLPELFHDLAMGELADLDGLPENVAAAVRGATRPDLAERLPSCEALLAVLEGERTVAPVVAPVVAPPVAVPAGRWALAGLGGTALLVPLLVGAFACFGLAGWFAVSTEVITIPVPMPAGGGRPDDRSPGADPSPSPTPSPRTSPSPRPGPSPGPAPAPAPSPEPKPKPKPDKEHGPPEDKPGKGKGR